MPRTGLVWWAPGLALVVLLQAADAADPAPEVRVIDGDTIEVGEDTVRLWGVDSAELYQWCRDENDQTYPCGHEAAEHLRKLLVADPLVACREVDVDRYGRVVAVCLVGGTDLAAAMVGAGHALDYPRYSGGAYADQEREARLAGRGVWRGSFENPAEWRRQR